MRSAMGNQDKTEENLILARKADPKNEGLIHVLGNFYYGTRQFDRYEKLYGDLLRENPDSIAAKKNDETPLASSTRVWSSKRFFNT